MKRIDFIKKFGLLSGSASLIPSDLLATSNLLNKLLPKVGIQLFSLPLLLNKNFERSISMLSNMGYSYLEFFGPYYFSSPSVKDTWKKYSFFPESDNPFSGFYGNSGKEVKSILSNYKMSSPSIHTDLETLENHMGELAKGAQECGAKYVVLPSIPADQRQNLDQYKTMADRFNSIGEAAKSEGVLFAYHNHGYGFSENKGTIPIHYVFENTDPDLVFLEMDIFWTLGAGQNPVELLKKYPKRYKLMHLKDMKEKLTFDGDGENPEQWYKLFPNMTSCGDGIAELESIIETARNVGVKYFYVEQDMAKNPEIVLKKSIDYLSK